MNLIASPCRRLLAANAGGWDGLFLHPVAERTVPMPFLETPPAMQVTGDGDWNLGMERRGRWPWIAELPAPGEGPMQDGLPWRPLPGHTCRIVRRYCADSLLHPLPPV